MNPVAENFSSNLRYCRKRAGMTQEGLAFDAGLHRTEIGLLETGARVPRIDTLVKLAAALSIRRKNCSTGSTGCPAFAAALTSRLPRAVAEWRAEATGQSLHAQGWPGMGDPFPRLWETPLS